MFYHIYHWLCCCCIRPYPRGPEVSHIQHKYALVESDLQILWEKFLTYVTTDKDEVNIDEFVVITTAGEEQDIFLRLVFLLFDDDMGGSIGFPEFLRAMYHFMTLEVEDLEIFTFQIFDLDGGGELEKEEINFMISLLWGGTHDARKLHHIQESMAEMDKDMSGSVDGHEWLLIAKRFPNLMFPAFSLQQRLRKGTMSTGRWDKLTEHRNKIDRKKEYESVREISETHKKVTHGYAFLALKGCGKLPSSVQNKIDVAQVSHDAETHKRKQNAEINRPLDYHHKKAKYDNGAGSHASQQHSPWGESSAHMKKTMEHEKLVHANSIHGAKAAKTHPVEFDATDPYHVDGEHAPTHHTGAKKGSLGAGFHGKAHNATASHNPHEHHETQKEHDAKQALHPAKSHDESGAFGHKGYGKVSHNDHGAHDNLGDHAHVDEKHKHKPKKSEHHNDGDDSAGHSAAHGRFGHKSGHYNEL